MSALLDLPCLFHCLQRAFCATHVTIELVHGVRFGGTEVLLCLRGRVLICMNRFHLPLLFAIPLVRQLLHIHLNAALHRWLSHICEGNEILSSWVVATSILDVLFEALLLLPMNVLLVVFYTTDRFEFAPILLAKFKLIESLPKHALLRDFERLARVVREARLSHGVRRCRCFVEHQLLAFAARVSTSHGEFAVAADVTLRRNIVSHQLSG